MASSSGKGKRKENPCLNNECYGNNNNNNNGSSNTTLGPFPPGFKFNPSDQQLIMCYLYLKVHGRKLPPNLMHDIDLYQPDESLNPEQLSARYAPQGEGEWYFFTPRHKKYRNGERPNRASAGGYWKASCKDTDIMSNGKLIGFRKALVFHKGKPPTGKKTNWIMHEFRLENDVVTNSPVRLQQGENDCTNSRLQLEQDGNSSKRHKLNDWVLFRIHYNRKGTKQANQGASPEANIPAQSPGNMNYPCQDPYQNGQSSAYATPEDVKVTYDNTVTIPTQFAGYHPTHHPQQSGLLASGPSNENSKLEQVHITNNNTVTIPTQFIGYHPTHHPHQSGLLACGPSNANSKLEEVHITNNNTVTIPTLFIGYRPTHHPHQSGLLACGPSNANSNPQNIHITNNNAVTIPTQVANNPTRYPHPNTEEKNRGSLSGGIYGNNQYSNQPVFENAAGNVLPTSFPNDFEIGNTGSASPFSLTRSEFGGLDNFNLAMSDIDMDPFLGVELLPSLSDFTGEFDNYPFDFDEKLLTNVVS